MQTAQTFHDMELSLGAPLQEPQNVVRSIRRKGRRCFSEHVRIVSGSPISSKHLRAFSRGFFLHDFAGATEAADDTPAAGHAGRFPTLQAG
jgi:hypothetical protein